MRIAFILTSFGIGGTERLVLSLAQRMQARGHSVLILVLCPQSASPWTTQIHVKHLQMTKRPWSVLRGYVRAARMLRAFRPALIHSHNFHGNLLARLLRLLLPSAQVLSTFHNIYEGGRTRMWAYRVTDLLGTGNVAVCRAIADRYIGIGVTPMQKCRVIANGIAVHEFVPSAARRSATRAELGAGQRFVWLAAARLTPAKDYPTLLRAFAHVHVYAPHTYLWIAGDSPGNYRERIRDMAAQLGLHASVRWLGVRQDMAALLDAADAFVLASAWEGMPLAIAEAMAMEKWVVATDVGGVGELLGDCGVMVRARDPLVLADAMLAAMRVPADKREQIGRQARQRVEQHFGIETKVDEWQSAYEECVAGGFHRHTMNPRQ